VRSSPPERKSVGEAELTNLTTLIRELGVVSSIVGSASGRLTSKIRRMPSLPPVTMCALSGDQSAARTILRCLSSTSSLPVKASHTLAV